MTIRTGLACAPDMDAPLRQVLQLDGRITVAAGRVSSPPTGHDAPVDVLVVDVESLGSTGLDLIRGVMQTAPLPVLALCPRVDDAPTAIQALLLGAVEVIPRRAGLETDGQLLRQRVHLVSGVSVVRRPGTRSAAAAPTGSRSVLAMAASTGGPAALAAVLSRLVGLAIPVLVVQHLHGAFMGGFVTWLDGLSALPVSAAEHGQSVRPGHVHVAPAGRHLRLAPDRTLHLTELPVTVHRPSADELFNSVASVAGPSSIGVVLTGMGSDGAAGLLAMRRAGGRTLVQDQDSCAVFGMPKAALDLGAADLGLRLDAIADAIRSSTGTRAT